MFIRQLLCGVPVWSTGEYSCEPNGGASCPAGTAYGLVEGSIPLMYFRALGAGGQEGVP